MKIAFIVNQFPRLSETFVLNQITGLINLGHEVDIYAHSPENELQVHADIAKYKLLEHTFYYGNLMPENKISRLIKAIVLVISKLDKHPMPLLNSVNIFKFGREAASLRIFFKIIPFLNKGPYEIIHCQFGPNGDLGALLKLAGAIKGKLITTFHGYDIRLGIEKGGKIYQRLFKEGDLFIAISDYNYKNLLNFGLRREKMVYHPVGIDLGIFPFKWQHNPRIDEKPIKIITVARLVEEKGLRYGIEAIHKLLQGDPALEIQYNIIGSGPLEGELKQLIQQLNLIQIVHLLGPREHSQVIEALKESHIFLLPSVAEALPVVLMEAQAVGLPVVATAVGSVGEIIANGKSGFCVYARNVDEMADKVKFLIEHCEIWPEMGSEGRRHVEECFDINKLNKQQVDIYRKLLVENYNGKKTR